MAQVQQIYKYLDEKYPFPYRRGLTIRAFSSAPLTERCAAAPLRWM